MKRMNPTYVVVIAAVAVVAAVALPKMFGDRVGARSQDGDRITETIALVDADALTTMDVQLLEGDADHEADHIFGALYALEGVREATLDTAALELEVAFDSDVVDEGDIRARLIEVGYVTPTVEDATAMTVDEGEGVQRIRIEDVGRFDPFLITAEPGLPIEIDFAPGTECRTRVSFPEIGVEADISRGAVVELPALEPGSYAILCGDGGYEAGIVVR